MKQCLIDEVYLTGLFINIHFFEIDRATRRLLGGSVARGVNLLIGFHPSSCWVNEILKAGFNMQAMRERTKKGEQSFFCNFLRTDIFRFLRHRIINSPEIFYGFDVPPESYAKESQYNYLTQIWSISARVYKRRLSYEVSKS